MEWAPAPADIAGMGATRLAVRAAGAGIFVALVGGAAALGGDLAPFVNAPGLLLVLGGTAALLLASFGHDGCLAALRLRGDAMAFFRLAAAYALLTGYLGTVIGLIGVLSNMDDPSLLGRACALTLLTQLYGALLAAGCIVMAVIQSTGDLHAKGPGEATRFVLPIAGAAAAAGIGAVVLVMAAIIAMFNAA